MPNFRVPLYVLIAALPLASASQPAADIVTPGQHVSDGSDKRPGLTSDAIRTACVADDADSSALYFVQTRARQAPTQQPSPASAPVPAATPAGSPAGAGHAQGGDGTSSAVGAEAALEPLPAAKPPCATCKKTQRVVDAMGDAARPQAAEASTRQVFPHADVGRASEAPRGLGEVAVEVFPVQMSEELVQAGYLDVLSLEQVGASYMIGGRPTSSSDNSNSPGAQRFHADAGPFAATAVGFYATNSSGHLQQGVLPVAGANGSFTASSFGSAPSPRGLDDSRRDGLAQHGVATTVKAKSMAKRGVSSDRSAPARADAPALDAFRLNSLNDMSTLPAFQDDPAAGGVSQYVMAFTENFTMELPFWRFLRNGTGLGIADTFANASVVGSAEAALSAWVQAWENATSSPPVLPIWAGRKLGDGSMWHGLLAPAQRVEFEALRKDGYLPQRQPQSPTALLSRVVGKVHAEMVMSGSDAVLASVMLDDQQFVVSAPSLIVLVWAAVCAVLLLRMASDIFSGDSSKSDGLPGRPTVAELEEQSWQRGTIDWLLLGWAGPCVRRWGSDDESSGLNRDDLGSIRVPEDSAEACHCKFDGLWQREVASHGMANASLVRVIRSFVGPRRMAIMSCASFGMQAMNYVVSVVAVEACLSSYEWLADPEASLVLTRSDLVFPLALMICTFTGVPLLTMAFESVFHLVEARTDLRLDAALSMMVYSKLQRLPAGFCVSTAGEEDAAEAEEAVETHGPVPAAAHYDTVQLIVHDIKDNSARLCAAAMAVVGVVPFTSFLLAFLFAHMGSAMLIGMLVLVPTTLAFIFIVSRVFSAKYTLQTKTDKRLALMKEVIGSIRLVRACAWESAHRERVAQIRAIELQCVATYFYRCATLTTLVTSIPGLTLAATLGAYVFMHGDVEPVKIFVCMQVLGNLQAMMGSTTDGLSRICGFLLAIGRVEAFLKLEEAPTMCRDREPLPPVDGAPDAPSSPTPPAAVRVHGDFTWQQAAGENPVLQGLRLQVPRGHTVAIIGNTGSGKSTLLHAVLGELTGDKDAQVETPGPIAYCAQTPWLVKGSLRSNILCGCNAGDKVDDERYNAALASASLVADVKAWAAGDQVRVGCRGVTLSGGQKARVALARAMYSTSDVVLVDDVFASLDVHTSESVFDQVMDGPLMQGRTRFIVLQPQRARLERFDEIAVVSGGRIVESGPSSDVMQSSACQALLKMDSKSVDDALAAHGGNDKDMVAGYSRRGPDVDDDDETGLPNFKDTLRFLLGLGDRRLLVAFACFTILYPALRMVADVQLAAWANDGDGEGGASQTPAAAYMISFCLWLAISSCVFYIQWPILITYAQDISRNLYALILNQLLSASVVKFHDKTPVGRIMQRMCQEVCNLDQALPMMFLAVLAQNLSFMVSFIYTHGNMPLSFTLMAIPLYLLAVWFSRGYVRMNTRVQYLGRSLMASITEHICEADATRVSVRAYGQMGTFQRDFACLVNDQVQAKFLSTPVILRWCEIRLRFMMAFATTAASLICLFDTHYLPTGTFALAISHLTVLAKSLAPNFVLMNDLQLNFLSVGRLQAYTQLPCEAAAVVSGDSLLQARKTVGYLSNAGALRVERGGTLRVLRVDGSQAKPLFEATSDGLRLKAAPGVLLNDHVSGSDWLPSYGYVISAVNGVSADAEVMAAELCQISPVLSPDRPACLTLTSGWLVGGAHVQIENLSLRYDSSKDVLRGLNLSFEASQKVAVVGRTGSGKSTLMLALLRIVEASSGRVVINGVDISSIGLTVLRQSLGLVPQDPVLFTGTLRSNLDPFDEYTDAQVWEALRHTKLDTYVRTLPGKLANCVVSGGENFSFGERQLLSLARMVLKQPGLLLMDEATSAIDPSTQDQVQAAILNAFPDTTIVAIAHRLETIAEFDYVVVLDNGAVAEKGPLKEVRNRKDSQFARMLSARPRKV